MNLASIILHHAVCPDGVEIRENPIPLDFHVYEGKHYGNLRKKKQSLTGRWFMPRTGELKKFARTSVDLTDPLSMRFMNTTDEESLTQFYSRFGLRYWDETKMFPVEREMAYRDLFKTHVKLVLSNLDPLKKRKGLQHFVVGTNINPYLHPITDGDIRMGLAALQLEDAMRLEVLVAIANGVKLAFCENCQQALYTGPLTGNRSHAKYCSNRCRVAAMRKRNAAAAEANPSADDE